MMCGKTVLLLLLSVLPWVSWGQPEPSLSDNLEALGGLAELDRANQALRDAIAREVI
jgi:hypothetical protein